MPASSRCKSKDICLSMSGSEGGVEVEVELTFCLELKSPVVLRIWDAILVLNVL
jgi:hypothetical protein